MKAFEVPDTDDERIHIPFSFPLEGKKLEFTLPRLDFIPAEDIKTMLWLCAELDVDEEKLRAWAEDPDENNDTAVTRAVILVFLKPYVTDKQFAALKKARLGQLRFIRDVRAQESRTTLGEFWASADS